MKIKPRRSYSEGFSWHLPFCTFQACPQSTKGAYKRQDAQDCEMSVRTNKGIGLYVRYWTIIEMQKQALW